MKHSPNYRLEFLVLLMVLIMVLAACVRPAPTDGVSPTPMGEFEATIPVIIPAVTATATAVIDVLPTDIPDIPAETEVTPAPTEPGSDTGQTVHIVAPGDTIYSISLRYDVSMEAIMAANNLANPDSLTVGQPLDIPAPGAGAPPPATVVGSEQTHVVSAGQNLFRIGLQYGCTADQLSAYNNIPAPYTIYVGDQIRIPPDC